MLCRPLCWFLFLLNYVFYWWCLPCYFPLACIYFLISILLIVHNHQLNGGSLARCCIYKASGLYIPGVGVQIWNLIDQQSSCFWYWFHWASLNCNLHIFLNFGSCSIVISFRFTLKNSNTCDFSGCPWCRSTFWLICWWLPPCTFCMYWSLLSILFRMLVFAFRCFDKLFFLFSYRLL